LRQAKEATKDTAGAALVNARFSLGVNFGRNSSALLVCEGQILFSGSTFSIEPQRVALDRGRPRSAGARRPGFCLLSQAALRDTPRCDQSARNDI
jgi:hypothetical protein